MTTSGKEARVITRVQFFLGLLGVVIPGVLAWADVRHGAAQAVSMAPRVAALELKDAVLEGRVVALEARPHPETTYVTLLERVARLEEAQRAQGQLLDARLSDILAIVRDLQAQVRPPR